MVLLVCPCDQTTSTWIKRRILPWNPMAYFVLHCCLELSSSNRHRRVIIPVALYLFPEYDHWVRLLKSVRDLAKLATISKVSHDHSYTEKINQDCLGQIKIQNANVILPLRRTLGLVSVAPSCPVGGEVRGKTRSAMRANFSYPRNLSFEFIMLAVVST